jgi:hypothetical protein
VHAALAMFACNVCLRRKKKLELECKRAKLDEDCQPCGDSEIVRFAVIAVMKESMLSK